MGTLTKIIFLFLSVGTAYVSYQIFKDSDPIEIPDQFWGPASKKGQKEDTSIRPFKINISEKVINDLKTRLKVELAENRLTTPLEGIGFQYGFNTKYLKTVGQHWLDKFDWKEREKLMNRFPHFKTEIDGIDIHFMHIKSINNNKYKTTRPLILDEMVLSTGQFHPDETQPCLPVQAFVVHGWPGAFIEFSKIIPLYTDPKDSDINFELVIPSIPGYGFSGTAARPGLGPTETANIFVKLMKRLGYNQFYAHGEDWGSLITTTMATVYPKNVMGLHIIMCFSNHPRANLRRMIASFYPELFMSAQEADENYPFSKLFLFMFRETGYAHLQWSKPDTIGVGLQNSPLGLAAYILEKFSTWTNKEAWIREDDGLTTKFTLDELLDFITLYWSTNSITTSMRFYAEAFSASNTALDGIPTKVPTGCFAPKNDLYNMPEFFIRDKYPQLVRYTRGTDGGHFTALEIPDQLSKDVISLFTHFEKTGLSKFDSKPK